MFELMRCESRDQALISILTVNLNLGYRDHAYKINYIHTTSVSDPYHLVGSGSVSGNVDMDPGSAKN